MQVGGRRTFFAGTNIFYILLRQTMEDPLGFTDDAVVAYFAAQVYDCIFCRMLAAVATLKIQFTTFQCLCESIEVCAAAHGLLYILFCVST